MEILSSKVEYATPQILPLFSSRYSTTTPQTTRTDLSLIYKILRMESGREETVLSKMK